MKKEKLLNKIDLVLISNSYFSIDKDINYKVIKKYWWKNLIIQIYKYNKKYFIVATSGMGIVNSAMSITFLIKKYGNIKYIVNYDYLDKDFKEICKESIVYSNSFTYQNVNFSKFSNTSINQILN